MSEKDAERPEVVQALRDLHEIYPDWVFTARVAGSCMVFDVPTRGEQVQEGFSAIMRPAMLVK